MKRFLPAILAAAVLTGCTANNEITEVTETSGTSITVAAVESTETTTEAEAVTETSEVTEKAAEYSRDVQKMARTFAKLVYEELENNKVSEDPTVLVPISCDREASETGFDLSVFEADIFFIDTDFDGVPELFAGGHGAMGTGRYSVFTADGGTYGNGSFAHLFGSFCIADGSMYAASGSNSYWGWIKLCPGLPSICFNGFWSETGTNDVGITLADGTKRTLTGLTFDEAKALYPEYLGVEYDDLNSLGENEEIPFVYARGLLEVPDPENYTEDDIYNCLAKLLAEYEKSAGTVSAAASAVTEKTPLTKADLGINEDGTLNDTFTKRIEQLMEPHLKMAMGSVFPTLWDFNEDGVPEIILIFHSGSQGSMPCTVYSAESLEEMGEFYGFCRDGFTRFVNRSDGDTVIYNYYEHSNWQRVETVEFVKIEYGKLVSENKIVRNWQTGDNMVNAAMVVYSDNSEEAPYEDRWYLGYNHGNVCTSYGNFDIEVKERTKAVVDSYNNYVKMKDYNYPNYFSFVGIQNECVILHENGDGYFTDESGDMIPLNNEIPYEWIYRLWDDIIVCQPLGNSQPCDVYIMVDGKPVLDEKISGHGMMLDYSKLYNGDFELIESAYDNLSFSGNINGAHTFKEYQFYRDESGFHEYGSIVVPLEEFNEVYGEKALKSVKEFAEKEWEIYEVLYRSDYCFILNCYEQVYADDGKTNSAVGTYYTRNITLKPMSDGSLAEVYRDEGVYKTALIPEIAVYPDKMYVPKTGE